MRPHAAERGKWETHMKRRALFLMGSMVAGSLLAGSLALSGVAQAHGIWFAQRAKQIGLIYGVGADDLDMVRRLPLIKGVVGYDAAQKPVPTSLRAAGPIVVVDSEQPLSIVGAWMDNGIWSKGKDGEWQKKGRDEVPDAVLSERTMKFTVHLIGQTPVAVPMIAEHKLQVVPVDAIPTQLGKPMKVKVLFEGKPAKGAKVLRDYVNDPDAKPLETGADGTVTLDVRNQGLNVLAATFVGPTDDKVKYDHIEYLATLSFVLAHAPE